MTLEDLHRTVVEGFGRIDERFARIEDRLARNEARWEQNEARWEQNEARWLENDARLREIGETTRRHFEAVAEQMQASVRIIAEGHAHLMAIRDNHEARLQTLEKRS
jgi:hypothetical protein